jgi:chitodextrinase
VTLRFDGTSIQVASVAPQANWVYQVSANGPRSVEVKFYNTATGADREFHAAVSNARITVET